MSSDHAKSDLMGLPTELRAHILRYVVCDDLDKKVRIACCGCRAHTAKQEDDDEVWSPESNGQQLRSLASDFATLLCLNKEIRAEATTFLFRHWQVDFCITHLRTFFFTDGAIRGPLDEDINFLGSLSSLTKYHRQLLTFVQYVPALHVKVNWNDFDWDYHHNVVHDWEMEISHWTTFDGTRVLIRMLNATKVPKTMRSSIEPADVATQIVEIRDFVALFTQLNDDIVIEIATLDDKSYTMLFNNTEDDASFMSDLANLQSTGRSQHFKMLKLMHQAWYKLLDWTEEVFQYRRYYGEEVPAEEFFEFNALTVTKAETLKNYLRAEWAAQHAGNEKNFAKAKARVAAMWQEHRDNYDDMLEEISRCF